MKINFKGQLQAMAGMRELETDVLSGESIASLVQRIAIELPEEARRLILGKDDEVRNSLFIAVDGEHTRDLAQAASGFELLLMPPMAGG
jgi:molybdopterin converting factor small subunit